MRESIEIDDEVTMEEIEIEEAKPKLKLKPKLKARKSRPRKKKEEEEVPPLPDPAEIAAVDCMADKVDLAAVEAEVSKVDADAAGEMNQSLSAVRGKFAGADTLEATSRTNRARAAALLLPDLLRLLNRPELIFALAQILEIRLTGATLKSPSLAAIRVLLPEMERRQQSFWAQVFAFAVGCGWTAQQFERALLVHGAVEIRRLETKRQRYRSGEPEAPSPKRRIEEYCARQSPVPVSEVPVSEGGGEPGLVLLLARRVGDDMVFYGVVDDEKQVIAAIRLCEKRNPGVAVDSQESEE